MATLTITISGTEETIATLETLGKELMNFEEENTEVGRYLTGWFASYPFASEGQVYGERWQPLSPAYQAWKADHYRGRSMLVASGRMQSSFYNQPTPEYVDIGNEAPYFVYHQLGTSKMPQRIVMQLNDQTRAAIADIYEMGVKTKLAAL